MKKLTVFALFIALVGVSGSALAQGKKGGAAPAPAAAGGGGGEANATAYDFEDDLVTGDLVRPDGELLSVRRRGNRASLIQIREHFIPEMLKSVEDL